MNPVDPVLAVLRGHLLAICLGSIFCFLGVCACSVAAIRHRREFLVLLWSGCFTGMYGVRLLVQSFSSLSLLPNSSWPTRIDVFVTYFLLIPGILFWVELSTGKLRRFLWIVTFLGLIVGIVGLGYFATTGSVDKFVPLNNLLAIVMLVVVGVIVAVPRWSKKFLLIHSRIVALYVPVVVVVSVYYNLSGLLRFEVSRDLEPAALIVWTLALGYIAAQHVFANERRLMTIEGELQTARQIQFSILPSNVPVVRNLRIAATYKPMSAVAGDFYHFLEIDEHRLGVLVADVSGHGVPAALISSMIKVAMQSVAEFAADPPRVLHSLNRILSPELNGQLISAAYLWIDAEHRCARYSAAGHPPLLCWRNARGELEKVESNGLLFGISEDGEYPVTALRLEGRDRLLIYTDGLIEPENATGEAFGERQLELVLREQNSHGAPEVVEHMLSALQKWQAAPVTQQDDITLIAVDVV
ncbi:MAG TPA: PP2C family protein-serine/threonine phosphatase [Candidatus Sulfotelmatobacter sp.]|nr:PP2C family protein-serine/threonine phosphatase [Candidatus Sulfotelmatobacter sp.]